MEKSIADLLSDAFSESSIPSVAEDEDFENLDFKVDGTILNQDNKTADQEDVPPLLEIASASNYQNEQTILDAKYKSQENYSSSEEDNETEIDEKLWNFIDQSPTSNDNEEFYAVGQNPSQNFDMSKEDMANKDDIALIVETPSNYPCNDVQETFSAKNIEDVKVRVRLEDCTRSEEERGEDEGEIEQKPGDFLETVHSSNDTEEVCAMGQDLGQKDKAQDSNQEEEEGYFGIIQGHEGNLMIQDESSEEDQQTESTKTMFFQVEYTLEYPEISYDEAEEFNEDTSDKMKTFSEEEHQEAGESFADYPSDFSSCEYVDNTRNPQPSFFDDYSTDHESGEEVVTEDVFLNNTAMEESIGENSVCRKEELDKLEMNDVKLREKQDDGVLESWTEDVFSTWIHSEDNARGLSEDKTDFNVKWERESENTEQNTLIMNEDQDESRCLTRVQTSVSSSCGSVDDSFFFNDELEVYDVTEEEDMEDEEEEMRKEQARIQAFYRFYDDEDGDANKEERQTKVQFSMETLSQVIHYDTDSSRELSSLSDEEKEEEEKEEAEEEEEEEEEQKEEEKEEDTDQTDQVETCPSVGSDEVVLSSSKELQEIEDLTQIDSPPEIPDKITQSTNRPICNRNHRCLSVLKLMLSLLLVVVMGLIMFWWVSDTEEWLDFVL